MRVDQIAREAVREMPQVGEEFRQQLFRIIKASIEKTLEEAGIVYEPLRQTAQLKNIPYHPTTPAREEGQSDDTKRLEFWLRLCGDGEHSHVVFFDREAIDAAMKEGK